MQRLLSCFALLLVLFTGGGAFMRTNGLSPKLPPDDFIIDTLASGLTVPWDMVFIDNNTILFTERNGKVRLLRNDRLVAKPVFAISQIDTTKKMGLLGLCMHPDFIKNGFVYMACNYNAGAKPYLGVTRYRFENDTLLDPVKIIDAIPGNQNHTGCRLLFGPDRKLYITTGDADRPALAQDLKSLNGKILRVNDDGSVPQDNPFIQNDTARKAIWTYGHRNTQGIAFQPATGKLFNSEHGPTGGDEVNLISKRNNYGWPVIHHTDTTAGMISPLAEYTPSIGPSQIIFYDSDAFPLMKGHLLIACLRGESIINMALKNNQVVGQEVLIKKQYGRIRALTAGPDGYIYFSTSQNDPPEGRPLPGYDMILRMRPALHTSLSKSPVNSDQPQTAVASKKVSKTEKQYQQLCAGCHGVNLEGTERAQSMRDGKWQYGAGRKAIYLNIKNGIADKGMPAWEGAVSDADIQSLAKYILIKAVN